MFKIEKLSKIGLWSNKITFKKRHMVSFVKQNITIRHKETRKRIFCITNDKMSKITNKFTFTAR